MTKLFMKVNSNLFHYLSIKYYLELAILKFTTMSDEP